MAKHFYPSETARIAVSAAKQYRQHFAGSQLLFVATDKHKHVFSLEVSFPASAFQSLTGLTATDLTWSAQTFFNACMDSHLKDSAITIPEGRFPQQKLRALRQAFVQPDLSIRRIGNWKSGHPLLLPSEQTGKPQWALGIRDFTGSGGYIPDELLEGDVRWRVRDCYWVIATYRRACGEPRYAQRLYQAERIPYSRLIYPDNWGDLPRVSPPDVPAA